MDRESSESSSGDGARVGAGGVERALSGAHAEVERIPVFHQIGHPARLFEEFAVRAVKPMGGVPVLTAPRASWLLLIGGAITWALGFAGKLKEPSALDRLEFLAVLAVGALLVTAWVFMGIYCRILIARTTQSVSDAGLKLIERSQQIAVRLAESERRPDDQGRRAF